MRVNCQSTPATVDYATPSPSFLAQAVPSHCAERKREDMVAPPSSNLLCTDVVGANAGVSGGGARHEAEANTEAHKKEKEESEQVSGSPPMLKRRVKHAVTDMVLVKSSHGAQKFSLAPQLQLRLNAGSKIKNIMSFETKHVPSPCISAVKSSTTALSPLPHSSPYLPNHQRHSEPVLQSSIQNNHHHYYQPHHQLQRRLSTARATSSDSSVVLLKNSPSPTLRLMMDRSIIQQRRWHSHFLSKANKRGVRCMQSSRSLSQSPHHRERRSVLPSPINLLNSPVQTLDRRFFSRSETLILVDWDDTLLPSSWLTGRQLTVDRLRVLSQMEKSYLQSVSDSVCSLLRAAVHCGRVVIVTNAESGWVDLSASKFMPRVLEALRFWQITVVSARSEFESAELQHPVQWKVHAFRRLLLLAYPASSNQQQRSQPCNNKPGTSANQQRNSIASPTTQSAGTPDRFRSPSIHTSCHGRKNVVSVGDSDTERIALIQCVKSMAFNDAKKVDGGLRNINCNKSLSLYKSFKFCENPTPSLLQKQLQLVQKLLPQIVHHSGNLDLCISCKLPTNQ